MHGHCILKSQTRTWSRADDDGDEREKCFKYIQKTESSPLYDLDWNWTWKLKLSCSNHMHAYQNNNNNNGILKHALHNFYFKRLAGTGRDSEIK